MHERCTLWKHSGTGIFYVLYGPRQSKRTSLRTRDREEAQIRLGQWLATRGDVTPDSPTVGAILEAYLKDREPHVRSKQTLRFSVSVLLAGLGSLLPEHLAPAAIKQYTADRAVKPGSILREIGTLRAALAWAVENRWLKTQPIISNPVPTPKPRDRWITKDEARLLLARCVEPHVRLFVTVSLMTAARMGAVLDLRWGQVDLGARRIDFGEGHGNKRRAIAPINDQLHKTLSAAKELAKGEFVIEWRGERVFTVKNGFSRACQRAEIKGVTPHILRHSAATWMALDGVPLSEIARMLGDTEATVERVYVKHTPDHLRRAAGALNF